MTPVTITETKAYSRHAILPNGHSPTYEAVRYLPQAEPAACPTAHLLRLYTRYRSAGRPVRWRANPKRTWLSVGDSTKAWKEAARRFPGVIARKET